MAHQKTDKNVFPLLEEALKDDEVGVRYGAVVSLREMGYDPAKREKALELLKIETNIEKEDYVLDLAKQAVSILETLQTSQSN